MEFSWGSTEAKVNEGVVDAIVDVTETGSTLRANGLKIIHTLLTTNTQLIANHKAYADQFKREKNRPNPLAPAGCSRGAQDGRTENECALRQTRGSGELAPFAQRADSCRSVQIRLVFRGVRCFRRGCSVFAAQIDQGGRYGHYRIRLEQGVVKGQGSSLAFGSASAGKGRSSLSRRPTKNICHPRMTSAIASRALRTLRPRAASTMGGLLSRIAETKSSNSTRKGSLSSIATSWRSMSAI